MTAPTTLPHTATATLGASRRPARRPLQRFTRWAPHVDAIRGSLFGITLVSISAIHLYLGPLRSIRPTVTFLLISCVAALLNPKAMAWSNLTRSRPARAVLLLLLLIVGSAVFGLSFGGSASLLVDRYYKVLVVFFLMVGAVRNARDLAILVWSYVTAIGVLLILSATVLEMDTTSTGLGRMGGGETMYDANDLGMLFLMGLPTALLTYYTSGRLGRIISIVVILGIPAAIALTGSRGAMVGLVVQAPILFLCLRRVGVMTRLGGGALIVGGLALGAPDGYWDQMRTILDPSEDYNVASDYGRVEIAKRGVGYMLAYPVFGVGMNNFGRAEGTISPIAERRMAEGEAVQWIAPHNTFVQVGAELGIPALLVWLSLLYGGSVGLWRLRRRIPVEWERQTPERRFLREACLFLPASFVAFATTSYFLNHAYTPPPYILFSFLAGVVLLVERELAVDAAAAGPAPTSTVRRIPR